MATTFADRWGVPVQASSDKAVALLDQASESAEPVARALVAASTPWLSR